MNNWRTHARRILNNLFLVLAVCGLVTYFSKDGNHTNGLIIIGIGMFAKVIEFIIRII